MQIADAVMVSRRRGVKKVEKFSKNRSHFQNHSPIYPVCRSAAGSASRMASRKKSDFFRFFLSDFIFFADIPNVRNQLRAADDTKKWRFFRKSLPDFAFVPRYTLCTKLGAERSSA